MASRRHTFTTCSSRSRKEFKVLVLEVLWVLVFTVNGVGAAASR